MATVIPFFSSVADRLREGARAATVVEPFRIWRGRSGQRHVFTRIDGTGEDLDEAVVIVARRASDGTVIAERVGLGGSAEIVGAIAGDAHEVWAHFLAETDIERRRVVADLAGVRDGRGIGDVAAARAA